MKEILERARVELPQMTEDRHFLHMHPELGMKLTIGSKFIIERLKDLGYEPREICSSGIVATVGKPGKTLLLRADYDALPIEEQTDVEYKSRIPGVMHACGHDTHAAMLLCAAKLLKNMEGQLNGTVKLRNLRIIPLTLESGSPAKEVMGKSKPDHPACSAFSHDLVRFRTQHWSLHDFYGSHPSASQNNSLFNVTVFLA